MNLPYDIQKEIKYEVGFLRHLLGFYKTDDSKVFSQEFVFFPGQIPAVSRRDYFSFDSNDWRPGFNSIGAPLVYIASFKVIDLIVEFILRLSPYKITQFEKKIELFDSSDLPDVMKENSFLAHYLKSIFSNGYKIRNVLVHRSSFVTGSWGIKGEILDRKEKGVPFSISWKNIQGLAIFAILLSDAIATGKISRFNCKLMKRALDSMLELHKLPGFGQAAPAYAKARIFRLLSDHIDLNFVNIVDFVNSPTQQPDPETDDIHLVKLFDFDVDLELFVIDSCGLINGVYVIPYEAAIALDSPVSIEKLSQFGVGLDENIDVERITKGLLEGGVEVFLYN